MESVFMLILLALVLLFYFSNRNNKVNQWRAYAAFLFWLGVEKEAVLFKGSSKNPLSVDGRERAG